MHVRTLLALAALGCTPTPPPAPSPAAPQTAAATEANAGYEQFAREFLDWCYAWNPVRSTGLGLHR
jgi:hypothetical protein